MGGNRGIETHYAKKKKRMGGPNAKEEGEDS